MSRQIIHKIYLLGIGGIGMSALARYFVSIGKLVYGYDKTSTSLTDALIAEGCIIHFNDDNKIVETYNLDKNTLFIYTPAIKPESPIYQSVIHHGYVWHKRSQVLGLISNSTFTIAVAGTHGKTTTSSLIAHLLKENGINFTAFLGGIASNFGTNYIQYKDGEEYMEGKPITIVEADEFDKSFLHLKPNISILTSTDADHLDIYGNAESLQETFQEFLDKTNPDGLQIIQEDLDIKHTDQTVTYGKNGTAKYSFNGETAFSYDYAYAQLALPNLECGLPGTHNAENSVAAITAILPIIENTDKIKEALFQFKGVKRRFEIAYRSEEAIVIDDYAHHPTELEKFITSVKMMFPEKHITGIFQPHLYTRTRDFSAAFSESLSLLDTCYLLPIYPARELPIEGIDAELICRNMEGKDNHVLSKEEIIPKIQETKPKILLLMGAGDIDRLVAPIVNIYHED